MEMYGTALEETQEIVKKTETIIAFKYNVVK
jgi:hypothetical protein